ncbi:MAG: T9SS type A sorting domain-containing protein [Flavobacteriales bacterium]|nr:T9SS type A sorting domain-containing protein [Flavobacteriales bacterium]
MRRFYVVSCALAIGLSSFAQLESPDIEAGESFTRAIGDYFMPAEDTGTMGQVWDMSSLETQSSFGVNILSAPLTALSKSFPDATYALDDGSQILYISYGDAWTFHGGTSGSLVVIYSDKQTYHPFPFAIGDAWQDDFTAEYGAAGITVYRTGSVEQTCHSSGTLTNPGGQVYEDVYRSTVIETLLDSTFLGTLQMDITAEYFQSNQFGLPLFATATVYTLDIPFGGTPVEETTQYSVWMDSYTAGTDELESLATWGMLPNPASDVVTIIRGQKGLSEAITLFSMDGKQVLQSQFILGMQQATIDVSNLPNGVYLVSAGADGKSQRLVIAH